MRVWVGLRVLHSDLVLCAETLLTAFESRRATIRQRKSAVGNESDASDRVCKTSTLQIE